jgi:hypothetical protein
MDTEGNYSEEGGERRDWRERRWEGRARRRRGREGGSQWRWRMGERHLGGVLR